MIGSGNGSGMDATWLKSTSASHSSSIEPSTEPPSLCPISSSAALRIHPLSHYRPRDSTWANANQPPAAWGNAHTPLANQPCTGRERANSNRLGTTPPQCHLARRDRVALQGARSVRVMGRSRPSNVLYWVLSAVLQKTMHRIPSRRCCEPTREGEQQSVATPQAVRGWAPHPADTSRSNLAASLALFSR